MILCKQRASESCKGVRSLQAIFDVYREGTGFEKIAIVLESYVRVLGPCGHAIAARILQDRVRAFERESNAFVTEQSLGRNISLLTGT